MFLGRHRRRSAWEIQPNGMGQEGRRVNPRHKEYFYMTSRQPYWCTKPMKRRPCWCPNNFVPKVFPLKKALGRRLGVPKQTCRTSILFLSKHYLLDPINLHSCWPQEWKRTQGIMISKEIPLELCIDKSQFTIRVARYGRSRESFPLHGKHTSLYTVVYIKHTNLNGEWIDYSMVYHEKVLHNYFIPCHRK